LSINIPVNSMMVQPLVSPMTERLSSIPFCAIINGRADEVID
jgi:hypothetical protein